MDNITNKLRFVCFYIAFFLCIGGIKAQQQLDPQRTNIALPITKTYNDSTKVHLSIWVFQQHQSVERRSNRRDTCRCSPRHEGPKHRRFGVVSATRR